MFLCVEKQNEGMNTMKKGFLALLMAAILSVICVTPAYAASISANEQATYDEFAAAIEKWRPVLGNETANTYLSQARSTLLQVELDATACSEFSQAVKDVCAVLDKGNPQTRSEMMKYAPECAGIVNKVGSKYGIQIAVGAHGVVTITIQGKTVASTGSTVKQTGFGLAQTIAVGIGHPRQHQCGRGLHRRARRRLRGQPQAFGFRRCLSYGNVFKDAEAPGIRRCARSFLCAGLPAALGGPEPRMGHGKRSGRCTGERRGAQL